MLDYIKLAANQTIEDLLSSLLIGHTYYIKDNTSNEYKEYVLVPKKKEYVGLTYDKNKVEDILVNKLELDEKNLLGVDLELPSGTIWAKCNVGASKPSDYGLYFQWGDTQGYTADQVGTGEGQKKFAPDYSDYKWGTYRNFTKYTTKGATLELEDDAAHVHMNMGGDWHMPTPEQIQELIDNTTTAWTTQDGVNGRLFKSKKDQSKSIFFPAAGTTWNGSVVDSRKRGCVLSCMTVAKNSQYVQVLDFNSSNVYLNATNYHNRCSGLSVRGVIG